MKGFVRMPSVSRLLTKKQIVSFLLIICTAMVGTFWFLGCNKTSFDKNPYDIAPEEEKTLPKPDDGTTPADHTAIDNYYIATGVLKDAGSFVGKTTGTSVSLGINQDIYASRTVLGNNVFKESYSFGVKKVGMQFYVSGKNYVMRDTSSLAAVDSPNWDSSTPYKISEETFLGKFGGKPLGICNYIIKDETVTSAQYMGVEDGLHVFRYDFDVKTATPKMLLEMKTMSGMDSTFTRAAIIVYMDNDWVVKKTTTDCEYVVSYGMLTPTCTESLTETFSALGEGNELPHGDVFGPYLEAEVTDPVVKDPTALDYIMSGFGAYMSGTPLVANIETDGLVKVKGAASVNIDINELSNIKARVQIDEVSYGDITLRDLFVAYTDETVYIKYGDLKAKGTIADATALVNKITALLSPDGNAGETGGLFDNLDTAALLDNMTLVRENGKATVGIVIPLGEIDVTATLEFTDSDTIDFIGASAVIGKGDETMLSTVVTPVETAAIPELEGTYYDVIPLVNDLIDENGNICARATVEGLTSSPIDLNAKINLKDLRVDASGKLGNNENEIRVRYDNTGKVVYLAFGDLKASFKLEDIPALKDKFGGLFSSASAETAETDKPSTIEIVKNILDGMTVTEADGKLTIALTYNKLNASLTLTENESAYGFGNITASYGNISVVATTCKPSDVKVIADEELGQFRNIVPITDIISDELTLNLHAVINVYAGGVNLENVPVDLFVDLNDMTVMAKVTIFEKEIFVKYAGDTVYVSALGLNAKASKEDISSIVDKFTALFAAESTNDTSVSDALGGLIDALNIDDVLASLGATATDGGVKLGGEINANGIAVTLGITLSDDGTAYSLGEVAATVTKDGETLVTANVMLGNEVDYLPFTDGTTFYDLKPLIDQLIDENGNICVSATVEGLTSAPIALNAKVNLKDLRVDASGKLGNNENEIRVRYDNTGKVVYLAFGDLKASFKLEDIPALKDKFGGLFSSASAETAETDKPSTIEIVKNILDGMTVTEADGKLTIALTYNKLNASLTLTENESAYGFGNITASYGNISVVATTCKPDAINAIADEELGQFRNIVPVTDIISDELTLNLHAVINVYAGGVNLENIPVDLFVDLNDMTVMAKVAIFEKEIFVKYAGDTVYVSALGLNAKASKEDISSIVDKFTALFAAESTNDTSVSDALGGLIDALNIDDVLASLGATATDGGVKLGGEINANGITVTLGITLADDGTAYSLGEVAATVTKDGETLVIANVTPGNEVDYLPFTDGTTFYDLKPLIDQLIDENGNIRLKLTIDTDVTDAIGDAISGAITDITDGKTEVVEAEKKPIVVVATLDLKAMRLTANVLGINALFDLKTNTLYAECGGAKVLLECGENFEAVKEILNALAPTIRTFAPDFDPNAEISVDIMATVEKLVKAMTYETDENGVTISLPIESGDSTVNVAVRLDAIGTGYALGGVTVAMTGTEIKVEITDEMPVAPAVFDANGEIIPTADLKANYGYIDLSELVDKFAGTINNICTAENMIVTLGEGCEVKTGDTTIALSGEIVVTGVNKSTNGGIVKVRADLKITIANADGTAKTYGLTVIYRTPVIDTDYTEARTTDENGKETVTRTVLASNAYFKLDRLNADGNSTGKPVIGTFSTANMTETLDILKTIYKNMPELQGALSFAIPESKDGQFHMPSIEDIGALVGGLTLDGNDLDVTLTLASLIHDEDMKKTMSSPVSVTLSALEDNALGVVLGMTMTDENGDPSLSVALNGSAQTAETVADDTFTYDANENAARTSDFTSINDLLRALAKTSENRHFEMSADIELQIVGSWKVTMNLTVALDVEGKNTFVTAKLVRNDFFGASIVYKDRGGTSYLYYYGEKDNEMFYLHNEYSNLIWQKKHEYFKYTKQEFTDNLLEIMLSDVLRMKDSYVSSIKDSAGGSDKSTELNVEDLFTKYSYSKDSSGNNVFKIDVSLDALTGGTIKDVPLTITSDASDNFKTVYTNLDISILNATLDASLTNYAKESQNIKAGMPASDNSTYGWSKYHK